MPKYPSLFASAPVNAPLTWPKKRDGASSLGSTPQFTVVVTSYPACCSQSFCICDRPTLSSTINIFCYRLYTLIYQMCQVQTFSSRLHVRGCPPTGKYEPKTLPTTAGCIKVYNRASILMLHFVFRFRNQQDGMVYDPLRVFPRPLRRPPCRHAARSGRSAAARPFAAAPTSATYGVRPPAAFHGCCPPRGAVRCLCGRLR